VALARSRRAVLVVDSGRPRNARADGVHNYLGREGAAPGELLATGRADLAGYGGEVRTGTVVAAARDREGFGLTLASGATVRARRLLVTTGLVDELPAVPGLVERWGRDVLHCPYCHGWEVRDRAIGVLASGPMAAHQALMWRQLSDDVTLLGPDGFTGDERLAARGVRVVPGEVVGVEVADDRLTGVRLRDGDAVPLDALVVTPRVEVRSALLASLGLEPVEREVNGHAVGAAVPAEPGGATLVPGVWLAGTVTDPFATVVAAAAAGLAAAAAINAGLVDEDAQAAASRTPSRPSRLTT
jgi:thioredoxin reductase